MSNKSRGTEFERETALWLSLKGYWVHLLQQTNDGQPADIIAIKQSIPLLIDCKVCDTKKGFALSRIEENQELAMKKFMRCGNYGCFFFVKYVDGHVRQYHLSELLKMRDDGVTYLKGDEPDYAEHI